MPRCINNFFVFCNYRNVWCCVCGATFYLGNSIVRGLCFRCCVGVLLVGFISDFYRLVICKTGGPYYKMICMRIKLSGKFVFFWGIAGLLFCLSACVQKKSTEGAVENPVYTNPVKEQGYQPWAAFYDGYYYYTQETFKQIKLWRTKDITDLKKGAEKVVWVPTEISSTHHIWGVEMHRIGGKWYIYFAASDQNMDNHQIFVLENNVKDPFEGEFVMKGRISTDDNNNWAIHPNVMEHEGRLYMIWSGWQSRRVNVETQCIYIAEMKNPWTLASERVLLSKPEYEWERQWINPDGSRTGYTIYVNESPQFFKNRKGDKVFIFYSASGNWTSFYALGMLTADADSDLLHPDSWRKSERPVFKQCPENQVYGPGHCSFIPSPDNKEDYMLYDARGTDKSAFKPEARSPRLQKIEWSADGMPYLGTPLPETVCLNKPSGLK